MYAERTINLNQLLNKNHKEFFQSSERTLVFYGGAAGGKSYSVADKILLQSIIQKRPIKALIVRKSMPAIKRTCLTLMMQRARTLGIPYELNKADMVMHLPFDSQAVFISVGNIIELEKIKSITDADIAWLEEANELSEQTCDQVDLRLRGGKGLYKQKILSFNPIGTTNWIYEKYFVKQEENPRIIRVTAKDNPFIEAEYLARLEALKDTNENLYRVYCLGEWGTLEGTIYTNYEIVDILPRKIDEVIYGLDFGFNKPTAMVKIYFSDNNIFEQEKIYQDKLITRDLINKFPSIGVNKNELIYADAAEPDRIEELCRAGYRVLPADKADVKTQIDYLKSLKTHVMSDSPNLKKEYQSYSYSMDKDGRFIDIPVKFRDHLQDGRRYALWTHLNKRIVTKAYGPKNT